MTAKDYRERAWNSLRGNWSTVVITFLVYSAILGVCGAMSMIGIGAILAFVLSGPLQYGLCAQSLAVVRGEPVSVNDILAAKDRFADTFLAALINSILIFLWSLLFIIPGIIKAYSYSLTFYVLRDNPGMSADAARRESERLMIGNKWSLFCLHLSFIGWILLSIFTFGILTLWIEPYMQCATAEFYDAMLPPRATVEHVVSDEPHTDGQSDIDPFDHSERQSGAPDRRSETDEPFYVFEEEIPTETVITGDSISPNKKPNDGDK